MKESTTNRDAIKKTDLWTAVLLLVFLIALHRFCAAHPDTPPAPPSVKAANASFCPGGVCIACFCAANDLRSTPAQWQRIETVSLPVR